MEVSFLVDEVRKRKSLWNKKYLNQSKKERKANEKLWQEIADLSNIDKDSVKTKWRNLRDTFVRMQRIAKDKGQEKSNWVHFESLSFLLDVPEEDSNHPESFTKKETSPSVTSSSTEDPCIDEDSIDEAASFSQESDTNIKEVQQQNLKINTRSSNQNAFVDRPPPLLMIEPQVTNPSFASIKRVYTLQDEESDELISEESQQYSIQTKRAAHESDLNLSEVQTNKEMEVQTNKEMDDENLSFLSTLLPFMTKLTTVQQLRTRIRFQEVLLDEFRT